MKPEIKGELLMALYSDLYGPSRRDYDERGFVDYPKYVLQCKYCLYSYIGEIEWDRSCPMCTQTMGKYKLTNNLKVKIKKLWEEQKINDRKNKK